MSDHDRFSMMAHHPEIKVLELCSIAPRPFLPSRPSLPLTYFDLIFLPFPPVQRLLFYELPTLEESEISELKQSLALAIHYYYPLAGSLEQASSQKPEIRFSDNDFVAFTVAVSSDDFYQLSGDHARRITRFHSLVPPLHNTNGRVPVFAVQVTVFPNVGISIGTTVHHAIADGSTYTSFMKAWSVLHRLRESASSSFGAFPVYDRSTIGDSMGLESIFLKDLKLFEKDASLEEWGVAEELDVMLATFIFGRRHLAKLRQRVIKKTSAQCSPYALACGFVWAGLVRGQGDAKKKKEHFGFVTGCRPRLDPPLSPNYFGNCLGICRVEANSKELMSNEGALIAADTIWKVIKNLEQGAFTGAQNWIQDVYDYASKKALTVAGSPKLGIYAIDFGWGPPTKVELISIEKNGALSLTESRDEKGEEKGGIEVGLALPSNEMENFISYYVNGLKELE